MTTDDPRPATTAQGRGRWRPFLPPLLLAAAIVATAPFMGLLRDAVFALFPRKALPGVAVALGVLAAALFVGALLRIREFRAWRYGGLVVVGLLLFWQVAGLGRGVAQVDVVERIHIVEYGSLAWLLYRAWRRVGVDRVQLIALPLLATLVAGALDESAQRFFLLRVGDWRDVLLNGFAAVCGVLFAVIFDPPLGAPRASRAGWARVAFAAAFTLLTLGGFFAFAHLGHEIADPRLGRFLSYYDAGELRAVAERRQAAWSAKPPVDLEPWDRKDLFLDEAARHVNYRNERYAAGEWRAAWQTNRILETWYWPFLGTETSVSLGGNRWSDAVRAEVEAKVAGGRYDPASFSSPVLRGHVAPWSHGLFYGSWLGVVALAAGAGLFLRRPFAG